MLHLFYKDSSSKQLQETAGAFASCEHLDISEIDSVREDELYLVEIDKSEKTLLLHIKKLLIDKTKSLIYFFINDSHNLMLFQLASLLNVKSIITPKHDTNKIILNIKKDLSLNKTSQLEHTIAKTLMQEHSFMIFNSKELKYASEKLYSEFNCKDLNDVKLKVCSKFDLDDFLNSDTSLENNFAFIKSITSDFNGDKFIYVENNLQNKHKDLSEIDFIKNRIYFIEILKEKILERSISKGFLGIITAQIENISNLRNFWSEYEVEMAIRDLLLHVEIELDAHTILAQYDNSLYVTLFEDIDFKSTKQRAADIQNHISSYTQKQKIKPIVGLYAFDINDLELNSVLKIISDISKEEISPKDIETQKLHRIINIDNELDEPRVIDIFLQATFTNKTPIKLLNIYKGLCINTSSTIVKKTEQEIYVTYEQLQGTVMQFEKETVMQSSNFSRDIIADVKYIDSKKKLALLKNFRFVQGSANARKYSRVIPSQRTPISLTHDKGTVNGEIVDISMNSIALKTRIYNQLDSLKLSSITLNFTLPIDSNEDGYMKLTLRAKVIFTTCDEKFCKIVVNLYEDQANESVLMEYVYNRQKEIIVELKKQTTMLN